MTSWRDSAVLHVDFALGYGAIEAPPAKYKLAIGTGTVGVSDARIGYGAIGSTQNAGIFTIGDATYGQIGTGGRIPGDGVDDASYTPLESYTKQVTVALKKTSRFTGFDTGTCSITFNDHNRHLDPLNLDGPFVVNGVTQLTRGRRVRVWMDWMGARRYLFTGFVDTWPTKLEMFEASTRTIECTDWFGLLALYDGYEQTPVGAGETVTARINRLLDLVQVPAQDRDIGTSDVTLAATTLAGNLLGNIKAASASDGGHVWVSADGKVTFRSKVEIWAGNAANNTVWTVTNKGATLDADTGGTTTLYASVPDVVESDAYSGIFLARDGGTTQLATDSTLKDRIGWITYERSDLVCETDTQVANLATYMLAAQPQDNHFQVSAITVRPDVHAHARSMALAHGLFDRVSVEYASPVSGVSTVTRAGLITGREHTIVTSAGTPTWATRFTLEDVTGLNAFRIGRSVIGSDDFIP